MPQGQAYSVYDAVALLPDFMQNRRRTPFIFGADFIAIPGNGTSTVDVKISDDADFVLTMQSAVLTSDTPQVVFAAALPLMVTVVESGSGRQVQNQPVHLNNMFGIVASLTALGASNAGPLVLPQPQVLVRSSTYSVSIQNLAATATFSVRLAFHGFKVYGPPLNPGSY